MSYKTDDRLRDEFKTNLLDRGSSNLVGDFLIELGIQVIRSGIPYLDRGFFNQVAETQIRWGFRYSILLKCDRLINDCGSQREHGTL